MVIRLSSSLKLKTNFGELFSDDDQSRFYCNLESVWTPGIVNQNLAEKRVFFIEKCLQVSASLTAKGKLSEAELFVYYSEIRGLSSDWELNGQIAVDVPYIIACFRYIEYKKIH